MMAHDPQADLQGEAIGWRIRLRDGGADEWDAFVAWLEGDPARSAVYDAVAAADAALRPEEVPATILPANDDTAAPAAGPAGRRWGFAAGGAAAVVAAALFLAPSQRSPARTEIATAAGERRTVALADGSAVALNGGTRILVGGGRDRSVELVAGEATFTVRHDERRPFEVSVGGHVVRDVGTVFNMLSDRDRFSLEVIEGAVLFDPAGAATRLSAGQVLRSDGENRIVTAGDPKEMAGWRTGQLSYDSAPLAAVIGDLSRSTGATLSLDPSLDRIPFTGSVRIEADRTVTVKRLADALGVVAVPRDGGWRLEPHRRAPR